MKLTELAGLLGGEVIWSDGVLAERPVEACFAADLMSDVLAFAQPGALLVTGLTSVQSAHTADVADLAAVLYVAGKRPGETVLALAKSKGIPLLTTPLSMYEACGLLHGAGIRSGNRRPDVGTEGVS